MLSDESRMYYYLLTIQAKDKQYITHTGDSLINRIVEFYEDYGNDERLMMAYYYQGRIYRDMSDAPRALNAFQKAVNVEFPNLELLTKIYSQMGYLFTYQGLYDEAIRVNKASIDIYQILKQEDKAYFAFRDIARAYEAKDLRDSALFYYEECSKTVRNNKNSAKYYNILAEQGRLLYNIGKTNEAKNILMNLWHNPVLQDKSHINLTLGYIYKELHQWDSAHIHFQKVLSSGNEHKQYYSHKSLFSLEYLRGNYIKASEHAKKALSIKEGMGKTIQTEDLAKINSLYNYQHIEEENLKLKLTEEHNKNMILALFSVILILLILFLLLFLHHRSIKEQHRINKYKLENLRKKELDQNALYENQRKIDELESWLQNDADGKDMSKTQMVYMQLQHLKLRNQEIQLSTEQQKLAIQTLKQTDIYKLFRRISIGEDIKLDEKCWPELQVEIKKVYPNFVLHLKELSPKVSDVELKICLLTKLGMPQSHIANVLGYTRGGVSLACERFYKKIFGTKYTAKEFAHFIEEI